MDKAEFPARSGFLEKSLATFEALGDTKRLFLRANCWGVGGQVPGGRHKHMDPGRACASTEYWRKAASTI